MPEATTEQVNNIAKQLGLLLVDNGIKFLESAFHLAPISVGVLEVNTILKDYFPNTPIGHFDGKYNLITWEQWEQLLLYDWTDTKKWILDYRDCDNFANSFAANMSMFYEINSAGRVYGRLYRGLNEFLDFHYWNVVITSDRSIYFIEPNTDKWTKYEGGTLVIGGNKYEVVSFTFG